jgi:integrase
MAEKSKVIKRGNSWFCRTRRKGIDIARSFDSKIDAEIWEKSVIREIDAGTFIRETWASGHGDVKLQKVEDKLAKDSPPPPVRDMTFRDALQRYAETVTIKKKGAIKEAEKISLLQRTTLATRPLNDLDSADFAAWRDDRLSKGSAAATVKQNLSIISHLFKIARREWGLKDLENPILDVAKPKVNNERSRRLSELEEKYLLDAIDNPGDGAGKRANKFIGPMVRFALETAMRDAEMLALDWRYVDLDNKVVILVDTKNEDKMVKVPLSPVARDILKSLQGEGNEKKTMGAVFVTTASARKQSWVRAINRAQRNYKKACEKDGTRPDTEFLSDFHFHDLRHEATSRLFETGKLDMMEVASITRHKDLRMLKRYTHLKAENIANKLG